MFSEQFFDILLNFGDSWIIDDVKVNFKLEEVDIYVHYRGSKAECPETREMYSIHDRRKSRRWRHLDTLQYKTFINCRIPRVKTPTGVKSVEVPWADSFERHTYLFERLVIDVLKATKNQTATSKLLKCGFNVINRIIHLSVNRGMERRPNDVAYKNLSIDEKSFRKGHNYITVLSTPLAGCVIDVAEGRDKEATKTLLQDVIAEVNQDKVETISMDMWKPYLSVASSFLPNAKIVHDRFHLVKYLNKAIDQVRKREVKIHEELKNTKYILLKNKANLTDKQHIKFEHIQAANYQVSIAWRMRENFRDIFGSENISEAIGMFIKWSASVLRTNIKEVIKVAKTFNNHLKGVCNALVENFSNAMAERLNGKIQEIKTVGRGYRTFKNFRSAILFFHGGLDLYPHK